MTKSLNEAETRAELIDPALADAGWGKISGSRVRREVITNGRLIGGGRRTKKDIGDYVLVYRGQKLAVIEAKRMGLRNTEGVGELDQDKLPDLLELKYHSIGDTVAALGSVAAIRDVFAGFQERLYVSVAL